MKPGLSRIVIVSILTIFLSPCCLATWQISIPPVSRGIIQKDFSNRTMNEIPVDYINKTVKKIRIDEGFLIDRLKSFAEKNGWEVSWQTNKLWYINRKITIEGRSFKALCRDMVSNYPLRLSFDSKSKIVFVDEYVGTEADQSLHGQLREEH